MGKVHKPNTIGTYSRDKNIAKFNQDKELSLSREAKYVENVYPHFDFCVEVYHSTSLTKAPNTIGLNVYYPNSEDTTHVLAKEYPIGLTDEQVRKFLMQMCKELDKKIPEKR